MRKSTLLLIACTLIAALNSADSRADTGASYSTGAGIKLPIMGVSKFGEASLGVVVIPSYTVSTAVVGGNGNLECVSPVVQGNSSLCTITPAINYHLLSLTDNGNDKMGSVAANSYTISNVSADHSLQAAFAIDTFTVTPSAGANGTISPNTVQTVNFNGTKSFAVSPADGYQIASVTGCGGTLNSSSYTTSVITGNCTVSATFIQKPAPTYPSGDLNGDGIVDISDALLALQLSIGLKAATPAQISAGDVAPLVNGKPSPNGSIDISDAMAILQKAVEVLTW